MEGGHGEGVHHTQVSAQFDIRLWDESVAQPGTEESRGDEGEYGEEHKQWTKEVWPGARVIGECLRL